MDYVYKQYYTIYKQNLCVGISLYKINWVILMNPSLPLTCIRNNMMCIKTPILLHTKISTEFGNFDIFFKLLKWLGGGQ